MPLLPNPLAAPRASLGRSVSLTSGIVIAVVMAAICALTSLATGQQTRGQAQALALEKASAAAQTLDAIDSAAKLLADRFYTQFAEGYAKEWAFDEASGDLTSWGERLNGNFMLVDKFNAGTGGVATVFARKGDDFVRIATSLKKENGERAVGTTLGTQHPAFAAMQSGKPYSGRAFLFGKHYMSRYQPMKDAAGKVVGILFIGFDLTELQSSLEKMVADARLFDTGGVVLIDPKGAPADAVFISHPSARGRKVVEAIPGADATLAALKAADQANRERLMGITIVEAPDHAKAVEMVETDPKLDEVALMAPLRVRVPAPTSN